METKLNQVLRTCKALRGFEAIDDGTYTTGISFNPLVILSEIHILISITATIFMEKK